MEEHRILELDNLIQHCIDGNSDSDLDGGSDFLKPLDSLIEKLTFGEIEELINHFKKMNKYHHVHCFICEMYTRFDKNYAVSLFLKNGEYFSPSIYWAGQHYYAAQEYGTAKDIFEKGYERHQWFCGKQLAVLYLRGNFLSKLRGTLLRLKLIYAALYLHNPEYRERYIRRRFNAGFHR